MKEASTAASKLQDSKEEILKVWEKKVRETIGAAKSEATGLIRDSIPDFIDKLVLALEKNTQSLTSEIIKLAYIHGSERANSLQYSIEDALTEYNILRKVIFSILEKTGPVAPQDRDIILEAINYGLIHAGAEFKKMQIRQLEESNEKLQEERGILKAVLEQMPAAVWIAKYPLGEVYLCNELSKSIINGPKETNHLHDFNPFVGFHLDGRKYEMSDWPMVRSLINGEVVRDEVIKVVKSNGEYGYISIDSSPVRNEKGEIILAVTVSSDVTESIHLHEKIKKNEETLKLAIEASHLGIWDLDLETNKVVWSENNAELFGFGSNEIELNFEDAEKRIHPDDVKINRESFQNTVKTDRPFFHEIRVIRPDGKIRWLMGSGKLIRDDQGRPVRVIGTDKDITHAKETELALKESEEKFKQLANSVPHLVWSASSTGKVDYYNNKVSSYSGVNFINGEWKWATLVHHDDMAKTAKAWESAVNSGTDYICEHRLKMKDGKYRWHLSRGTPIKDSRGKITRWYGTATDIHDLKKALADIKDITDIQPTLISYVNKDQTYKFTNHTYKCWFNECREIAGASVSKVVGPAAYEIIGPYLLKALEGQRQEFELWIPYQSGARYIDAVYHPDIGPGGEVLGVFVSIEDKTKEQTTLESLKSSEQQFISLANSIPQLAWMADPDGFIFWYNQRWYEYTGTTFEEMQAYGWKEVQHPDFFDKVNKKIKEKISSGEVWEDTFPLRSSNGEWRWFLSRAMPIRNETGSIVRWFGTNTDITEQKKLTDSLHEEQLLRDKFISTLTHDLRTPLTAAKISAQLIKRRTDDEKIENFAFRVVENLDRADNMIQDLLDAGKIQAGKMIIPEIEHVDLVDVIANTLEDLTTIHGDRFILKAPSELFVKLSPNGIRRAIENLCINAIKYGSTTDPVIVSVAEENENVSLSVQNKGNPLINVDNTKLFEYFQQGAASSIAGKPGWGIGLTIVKGVAEGHGGKVLIESNEEGTTFQLIVPKDATQFIKSHIDRNEL